MNTCRCKALYRPSALLIRGSERTVFQDFLALETLALKVWVLMLIGWCITK
jgi:hypothetical protein